MQRLLTELTVLTFGRVGQILEHRDQPLSIAATHHLACCRAAPRPDVH
jgi:hypothetical protein